MPRGNRLPVRDTRHRPELDGLRGLAVLLVVADHAQLLRGGWVGVDLFFALSGYLITGLLLAEHERTGTVQLRRFYWRRVVRLAPALIVALTGLVVLTALRWPAMLGRCVFAVVLVLVYAANVGYQTFPQTGWLTAWGWSLSLEEQFYAVWPRLLRSWLHRLTRREIAIRLVTCAAVLSAARVVLTVTMHSWAPGYYVVRGEDILLGSALAVAPVTLRSWHRWAAWLALGAAAGWLVQGAPAAFGGITVAAVASVAVVASARDIPVLRSRVLVHVGEISYALYLWNSLLLPLLGATWVWFAVSLAAAEASTWLLERPVRRLLMSRAALRQHVPLQVAVGAGAAGS